MCAISAVHDYGYGLDNWNEETLDAFKKLLDAAKIFDDVTKQPDCVDPEKTKWLEVVEAQVKE